MKGGGTSGASHRLRQGCQDDVVVETYAQDGVTALMMADNAQVARALRAAGATEA